MGPAVMLALLAAAPLGLVAQERVADRVASLVEEGRLQEAAWEAREGGDTARADALLARLERILRSPPVEVRPLSMDSQGVSYTFRLNHGGGVQSIFKVDGSDIFCRACGAGREIAAYEIDRLLGIGLTPMTVPATVVVNGDTLAGSAMYFVEGASSPREVGARKPDRLRFFDAAIGNSDRHQSNWLVLPDGRAVAIDHNRAFQYAPDLRPKTCWETEVDSILAPASLGRPFERYRTLPDDSLAAALSAADPDLARTFLEMRDRVVARIEARARDPGGRLPYRDCLFRR